MEKEDTPIKRVTLCAWCDKEKNGEVDELASVNYGICSECLDKIKKENRL